ncbi:MAG TPA: pilus assembly protein TadG-related protein [Candidatus Polarisedimenticolia bacterium]|nr:pilus assembly protein TadG-related protein [Candidatus Polarisedimenticolia bacterium]
MPRTLHEEKGASIVLVAICMVVLLGMAALAIDVGVLHTARAQCQNAADAGALACGGRMVTFNQLNPGAVNQAKNTAVQYANFNKVLSQAVAISSADVTVDLNLMRCRVCVPRTLARGNPIPTFFAKVLGNQSVDVSACATAEIANAQTSNCVKPWALPDAFDDANGNGVYDAGEYYAAGVTSYGTDYRQNGNDVGVQLIAKQANPQEAIAPGQFFPIDLPIPNSPDTGGDRYRDNITSCNPTEVSIGDTLFTENGNMIGPTKQAVQDLIALDPNATWDSSSGQVTGSAYGAAGSPRIIRIPFFDPSAPPISGKTTVLVTNIASLFLEAIDANGVVTTRIMLATGQEPGGNPGALKYVRLVE